VLFLRLLTVILPFLLIGCATSTKQESTDKASAKPAELIKPLSKNQKPLDKDSLDPDVLFMLLTAELAGQRGQYELALEGYMEAAKRSRDPRLAERAAMIAMYIKDPNKTNEAVSMWLKTDPNSISARKLTAVSVLRSGNKQASVEQLDALLKLDPAGFDKTVFELSSAIQKEGNAAFLYEVLESIAAKNPKQSVIYFIQSLLAADMKDMALAHKKIEQALSLQPDWDKALLMQAQLAIHEDDYPRGESLLRADVQKYPENDKFKKLLAQVLIKEAKYEEAGDVFESLIAANPKDLESKFSLGLVFLQLDKDNKAEDIFQELQLDPEWRNQSSLYLGKIEEKRDNIENAITWYDKVTEGPLEFEAAVTAIALLSKTKQFALAEDKVKALEVKFPKQKTRITLIKAEILSQQKKYQQAYDFLSGELKKNPDQEELLYSRALMADRLDRFDVMETDLKKILERTPGNVEALNALGYSLADKTKRYTEAEAYLMRALRLKPDEAVILDSYGWLKYKMGDSQAALDYLQRAYDKQPENEIAAHLAEVLWVSGQQDKARKLIKNALDNSPDDTFLQNFKNKFLQSE